MLSLIFIGIHLEQQFGFSTLSVPFCSGSVLSSLFIQRSISVGASGALFGLLGAMLSELLTNWTIYTNKAAALITLTVIIVINLAVRILPHVGRKHLPASARVTSKHKAYQYLFLVIAMVLLIVGFTMGLVMLFRGENGHDHCSWCHYLSCVPTSKWHCGN
ncbi:hypothetical protein ES332_A05G227000v1 [Gossypium tomentosum]|uniref:RHOMBOID-like protein n=1 Tax=Gossypium tomentosum TaxID=34277 RepID=A0A5D2QHX0_GOSTO|nr:hypothetical protein ES332_A05G227000v1 [Gossypium tomentosum]